MMIQANHDTPLFTRNRLHYKPPSFPRIDQHEILYDFSTQNDFNPNLSNTSASAVVTSTTSTSYTLFIVAFLKSLFDRIKVILATKSSSNPRGAEDSHQDEPLLQEDKFDTSTPPEALEVSRYEKSESKEPRSVNILPSDLSVITISDSSQDNLYQSIFQVDSDEELEGEGQYGTNLTIDHKAGHYNDWSVSTSRHANYSFLPIIDDVYSDILKPLDEYDKVVSKFYTPFRPVPKARYSVTDAVLSAIPSKLLTNFLKKERESIQNLIHKERTALRAVVTPLTPDQLQMVELYWRAGRSSQHIVSGFSIDITTKDLLTLSDRQWLNDNVIDFYLNLVTELTDLVYCWTTHFFTTLKKNGYKGVARWAKRRKINVMTMDTIVVPINSMNTHWSVAVIDNFNKTISYFDSLSSGGNLHAVQLLDQYMRNEAERLNVPPHKYDLQPSMKTPQQQNGFDCGVFTCTVSKYIAKKAPLLFSQKDMHTIRRRMAYEIVHKTLLPEGNLSPNL